MLCRSVWVIPAEKPSPRGASASLSPRLAFLLCCYVYTYAAVLYSVCSHHIHRSGSVALHPSSRLHLLYPPFSPRTSPIPSHLSLIFSVLLLLSSLLRGGRYPSSEALTLSYHLLYNSAPPHLASSSSVGCELLLSAFTILPIASEICTQASSLRVMHTPPPAFPFRLHRAQRPTPVPHPHSYLS